MRVFLMTILGFLTISAYAEKGEEVIATSFDGLYQLILKTNTEEGQTHARAYSIVKPGTMYRRPIRVGFSSPLAAIGGTNNWNLWRLHLITRSADTNRFHGFIVDEFEKNQSFRILEQNGAHRMTCSVAGFQTTKLVSAASGVRLHTNDGFVQFTIDGGEFFLRVDLKNKLFQIRNQETRASVFEGSCK